MANDYTYKIEDLNEAKDRLRDMVEGLVQKDEDVEVTHFDGAGGPNLVIHCSREDRGRVIGKDGTNIEALRAYFRSYATFNGLGKLYVHLEKLS
jgi:predicted RNA-binding protein YlqC (UPF0109 family)